MQGYGVLPKQGDPVSQISAKQEPTKKINKRSRVRCRAKTRNGTPCLLMSEPGRKRCKFHGGKSTGPKTMEGRKRIAEAQRHRWAKMKTGP